MNARDVLAWCSSAGFLLLAAICIVRGARSPLAVRLALLAFVVFGWSLPNPGGEPWQRFWHALDLALTPWTPYLVLEIVVVFVGRRARARALRVLAACAFGGLSLLGVAAFVSEPLYAWADGPRAAGLLIVCWLPTLLYEIIVLALHLRLHGDARESSRTRMLLGALALAALSAASDLLADLGLIGLRVGPLGWLAALLLLALVVFRYDIFEREREQGRDPRRELALLGRYAAQMAHDLGNPLTALDGAVRLLPEDFEFTELMREQVERMREILVRYARLTRVEPQRSEVDLAALVSRCTTRVESRASIEVHVAPSSAWADETLLESALDALLVNAVEAGAKRLEVNAERSADGIVVRVVDDGTGMNARDAERATEDFFTTKATGSGLGLSFARRVTEAHGGTLTVGSRVGEGTRVTLRLPLA